jgi:hypothetical protein
LLEREVVMRCLVLGALIVVTFTGCGGPGYEPPELRSEPAARSQTDREAIRKYALAFGEDAVDTCVRAFDEDNLAGQAPVGRARFAGLPAFLCSCVGASTCL